MKKIYTLITLSVFFNTTLSAQRLLTEDFNYAAGQLTDANGGANVSGGNWVSFSGTGNYLEVTEADYTYADYVTNPAADSRHLHIITSPSSAEDASTAFTLQNANTVYCSFLLNVDSTGNLARDTSSTGEYFAAFLPSTSTSSYGARVLIRKGTAANTFNLGIAAISVTSTPAAWVAVDYAAGTTTLVTFAYEFVSGANNDVAKLWINTPLFATEPAPLASSILSAGSELADVGKFALRQASTSSPTAEIDAIKLSTDWIDATLPVTLKSFNLINDNRNISLAWTTENEINMKEYAIERSADAHTFSQIGSVDAKNTLNENKYSFNDTKKLSGTAYYRLKMINKDGSFVYSEILRADEKALKKLWLNTNPVINNLVLSHPLAGNDAILQIITMNGRNVATYKVQSNAVQSSIDVSKLSKGNYIAVFINGNDRQSIQFVKE
ncbi:MAG: T9SS type A sorting domain-containing protein [Parafilimonas sp.]